MNVVGLLNWYDEHPSWLAACVASMAKLCRQVVAVDGAYLGFPGALSQPSSHPEQAETIQRTAAALGMGATTIIPNEPWESEVAKRATMFRVARALAAEGDWLLSLDADELLSDVGDPIFLENQLHDVAEVLMWDRQYDGAFPIRRLFRALPDITVEYAHYVVTATKDGRKVRLSGEGAEDAFSWSELRIEHRSDERDMARNAKKQQYLAIAGPVEQRALANA